MSVIVIGMKMPENCLRCDLFAGNGCKATRTIFPDWMNIAARPKGCPLRLLPENHGRLIDADALKKTFRDAMDDCEGDFKRKEDAEEVRRWVELLCRDFDAQPTIVEAEGGEE